MKDRLAAAGIEIYGTLKPTIENVVMPLFDRAIDKVTGMAAAFTALSPAQQENILKWVGIAAAVGPATWAIGGFAKGLSNIIGLVKLLTADMYRFITWVKGPKFAAAMLAGAKAMGPLVLAAGAVYAAFKVWDAWQKQKAGIFMTTDKLKPLWETDPNVVEGEGHVGLDGTRYDASGNTLPSSPSRPYRPNFGEDEFTPMAEGGIVTRPTLALIGEAGPEAVVPLGKMGGGITININGPISSERDAEWYANEMVRRLRLAGVMP
jgi:hypothetical protein